MAATRLSREGSNLELPLQGDHSPEVLREDGERIFCRARRLDADGNRSSVLAVLPAAPHPLPATVDRLYQEYGLRDQLDRAWSGPQGPEAGQYPGQLCGRTSAAHRVRHNLAPAAGAAAARACRIDRRHPRIYGARTDRTNEPFDRLAQRPLLTWHNALSDGDRPPPVHRVRSHGMGPLPYCTATCGARQVGEECPAPGFPDHHEAAREDPRGALPNRRRG